MHVGNLKLAGASVALAALVAGCSTDQASIDSSARVGEFASILTTGAVNEIYACKWTVDATTGNLLLQQSAGTASISLNGAAPINVAIQSEGNGEGKCTTPAVTTIGAATPATITETPAAGYTVRFIRIAEYGPTNLFAQPNVVEIYNSADPTKNTLPAPYRFETGKRYEIWIKNAPGDTPPPPPPPPPGNKGCTPGFWRNSFGSWVTYAPGDKFETVFVRNVFSGDPSLGQTIALGGGGVNALARHATAALLNAAQGFYPYTTAEVISRFQAAFDSGNAATIEAQKSDFDAKNNLGCPLSNDNSNTDR